jgi:hypothetical protein
MKPSPPPPPPSPPRRHPSGITTKKREAADPTAHLPRLGSSHEIDPRDAETAIASYALANPPEPAAAPEPETNRIPPEYDADDATRVARDLAPAPPSSELETVARDLAAPSPSSDETRARAVDDLLLQRSRKETPVGHLEVAYESLPSLEVARPFDRFEAEFAERDPRRQHLAAAFPPPSEDAPTRRPDHLREDRDASGPRVRPEPPREASFAYSAPLPAYDESPIPAPRNDLTGGAWPGMQGTHIPPAPRLPNDFVMGVQPVQPIRTHAFEAPLAHVMPPTQRPPAYPPAQPFARPQPHAAPYAVQAHPPAPPHLVHRAPVGVQLTPPPKSSTGRLIWFVVGAVFGIGAFLGASHLILRSRAPEAIVFPPAAPLPSATPVETAPPAAAPPPPVTPATLPNANAKQAAATPPSTATVKPQTPPPAPPRTRGNAVYARRPAQPSSAAPKQMYTGSAPINDDGSSAAPTSSPAGGGGAPDLPPNASDLLGAALKP